MGNDGINEVGMTRQLTAKWTVDLDQADPEYGEDLEEEVAKVLREEIDWECTCDLMLQLGWTKVSIRDVTAHFFFSKPKIIESWLKDNIEGKSRGRGTTWLFEHEKDAMLFLLRWS